MRLVEHPFHLKHHPYHTPYEEKSGNDTRTSGFYGLQNNLGFFDDQSGEFGICRKYSEYDAGDVVGKPQSECNREYKSEKRNQSQQ